MYCLGSSVIKDTLPGVESFKLRDSGFNSLKLVPLQEFLVPEQKRGHNMCVAGSGVPWGHGSCTGDQNRVLELLLLQTRVSGCRETCEPAVITVEALDDKGLCWWLQRSGESFSDIQGAEPGAADCSGKKERES